MEINNLLLGLSLLSLETIVRPIHVRVDSLSLVGAVTEEDDPCLIPFCSNTRDEVYISLSGDVVSSDGSRIDISQARISPSGREDYFQFERETGKLHHGNIALWSGDLSEGDVATLNIAIAEQDNAQLSAIRAAVEAGSLALAGTVGYLLGIPGSVELLQAAINRAQEAGERLLDSISETGDEIIGGVSLVVHYDGEQHHADWQPLRDTVLSGQTQSMARATLTGGGGHYEALFSVSNDRGTYTPLDFTGDGITDLVITTNGGSYWYISNGDGTWTADVYTRGDLPL